MSRRALRRRLAGLVLVTAGVIAGCGASHPAGSSRSTTTPTRTHTTTTSSLTTTATATATSTSVTGIVAPTVRTVISGTTTAIANPDLPGTGRPRVLLGDMNTPEQFVIGELYAEALGAQGYTVQLSRNIGTTLVSQAALAQGSLDLYPEYLDTFVGEIAGDPRHFDTLAEALAAGRRYAASHGQTLLAPTPFSDTAGVAVLTSYARAHHLHSIADLRRVQTGLSFGSPLEFSSEPTGLLGLERAYGFIPALTATITIGSQYRDLADSSLQAVYDQTTDPQLSEPQFTNLADTRHVFGFGNVVPVVSTRVLAAEGPAFAATIDRVDALLSFRAIRGLTSEMAGAPQPGVVAAAVATGFLQGYGIVAAPSWSIPLPVTTTTPTSTSANSTTTARPGA